MRGSLAKTFMEGSVMASILKARLLRREYPAVLHINITHKCDLKCKHCYGSYPARRSNPDLPPSEWIKIAREARGMGVRIINLAGGEPLMYRGIGEVIDAMTDMGIAVHMNTNGDLFAKKADEVKNLASICFSIDGDRETHDAYRGKGQFDRVINGIKLAKRMGYKVHINTTILGSNVHTVVYVMELAWYLGIGVEFLLNFMQTPEDAIGTDWDLRGALLKIITAQKAGYPVFTSPKSLIHALQWPDYKKRTGDLNDCKRIDPRMRCVAGRFIFILDADSTAYPCAQWMGHYPGALKVTEHGLEKAYLATRREEMCQTCYASTSFNDYALLSRFHAGTVWHHAKQALKGIMPHRRTP